MNDPMTPFNPNVVPTPTPQADHSVTANPPSEAAPATNALPPTKGSLPYAKADYENLPPYERTPELDFLILGKIPGGKRNPSDPPLPASADFNDTVIRCLLEGELDALDFLWRESGRDPASTPVDLSRMSMEKDAVATLVKHCAAHPELKVDLCLREQNADVIGEVSHLVKEGKVNQLELFNLSEAQLEQMAPTLGKVRSGLCIRGTPLTVRCEQQLAEALGNSKSLSVLNLTNCRFGDSQGKYFVNGLRKNGSIIKLDMHYTPLPTIPEGGYRELLTDNPTLRQIIVLCGVMDAQPDIDAMVDGLMDNHVLRELRVLVSARLPGNPEKLGQLVETNRALTELVLPVGFESEEDYQALEVSLAKNTSLTTFAIDDGLLLGNDFAGVVADLMSRNRALASDPDYLMKAGRAFDPHGSSGLADPGVVIASEIFFESSSRDEFETTMTEIELSIRELERRAREAAFPPPVTPVNTTGVTLTTETTTTATTTTTTTNTTTSPPGS